MKHEDFIRTHCRVWHCKWAIISIESSCFPTNWCSERCQACNSCNRARSSAHLQSWVTVKTWWNGASFHQLWPVISGKWGNLQLVKQSWLRCMQRWKSLFWNVVLQLPVPDRSPGWGRWRGHLQLSNTHWRGRHFSLRSPSPQEPGHGGRDGQPVPYSHHAGKMQSWTREGVAHRWAFWLLCGLIVCTLILAINTAYLKWTECVRWSKLCGNDVFRVSPEWMWLNLFQFSDPQCFLFSVTYLPTSSWPRISTSLVNRDMNKAKSWHSKLLSRSIGQKTWDSFKAWYHLDVFCSAGHGAIWHYRSCSLIVHECIW